MFLKSYSLKIFWRPRDANTYLMLASPDLSTGDWNAWSYNLTSQHVIVALKYLLFTSCLLKKMSTWKTEKEMGVYCEHGSMADSVGVLNVLKGVGVLSRGGADLLS